MKETIIAFIFIFLALSPVRADDWSGLNIVANTSSTTTYVQLLVTDPQGRQTGFLPASGVKTQDILNSSYLTESVDNDETGEAGTQVVRFGMTPISSGSYVAILIGLADTTYSMNLDASDTGGGPANIIPNYFSGYLKFGTTKQFELAISPAPGAKLTVIQIVSFDGIRNDLSTMADLGQIGDKRFVNELDDILAQGERALARKDPDDHHGDVDASHGKREAVAKLREFIMRVNQAARTRPDDHGDLGRDNDARRFVTATAAQSLISDAKTLISLLGGKPQGDSDDHARNRERH